jgi:hypothetical protein
MASDDLAGADLGTEEVPADLDAGSDVAAAMDDFGGADAASGPEAEPLGRARKESVEAVKAPLNESIILETAGQKLIEAAGLDSLINWLLTEAAAGMPDAQFRTFATSVAQKAAKDPVKLAGFIGKKKLGMAAMAQLAEPTFTATPDLSIVESIEEGKTYKYNADDEDGNEESFSKKDKDVARSKARQAKDLDKVEEGKSYKYDAEDADEVAYDKKENDIARSKARKAKQMDKVDETVLAARAIAQLIEASIKREGKGFAAKAVKEAAAYLAGKNLVEGDTDVEALVLETFEAEFGMKPAAYSVSKLKEFMAPMSTTDKKNAGGVMTQLASKMANDKNASNKAVSTALSGLDGTQRNIANKIMNQAKADGKPVKTAGDLANATASAVNPEDKK